MTKYAALFIDFLRSGYERLIESQQVRMSNQFDGLPLLTLLGLVCGLLAGGVIIAFRLFMDSAAQQYLPAGNVEGFEGLSPATRFGLCVVGGLVIGIILRFLKPSARNFGVTHVIERLNYFQGYLPLKNAVVQFIVASLALLSGHSVGREGPSIHLGAAAGSVLGRRLHIPNNSLRILVGCGVAAAIAAAFNTPLAGVIFAMEVVLLEYTVIGFIPIIIAAVSATTLTRIIFGDVSTFGIPEFGVNTLHEIPVVVIVGAIIGVVSASFIQATLFMNSLFANRTIWLRTTLAGLITGLFALLIPQIMGTGYDTINHVLLVQIGLSGVMILTIVKVITSATAIGLGIPAGLIGPTLFIGASAGSSIGLFVASVYPEAANTSFYTMLGMAAMMAATLQAPLAALIFLLELTANPEIILPGMIAVVTASLVTRVIFKKSSIYQHLFLARGLDHRNTPMSMELRRIGVASVMDRGITQQSPRLSREQAEDLLTVESGWILLTDEQDQRRNSLLPCADLALYLNDLEPLSDDNRNAPLDLLKIPAKRLDTQPIIIIATLQEAYELMQANDCSVLFITGAHGATKQRIYGVVTRQHIERSYQL